MNICNAYMQPQARSGGLKGKLDYVFNGTTNHCGIEVMLNAVATKGLSQNIDEYASRFASAGRPIAEYEQMNFAILNFAVNKPRVLPADKESFDHDRMYTFDYNENVLYQGNQLIKAPAVMALPCMSKAHTNIPRNRESPKLSVPSTRASRRKHLTKILVELER